MKRKLIIIALSILLALNSFGEENQIPDKMIDVETAVQSALQTHLSVQQSKIQLEQTKRKYEHSWNNFLPSLSANVNSGANGTKNLNSLQSIHNAYSNAELQYRSQQLSLINSRVALKSLIDK